MNSRASKSLAFGVLLVIPGFYASAQTTTTTPTTTITDARTTAITTRKGGDINLSSTGTITVGKGSAVKINSDNSVNNAGSITINDAPSTNDPKTTDPSAGILAIGGYKGTITNSGSITNTDSVPLAGETAGQGAYAHIFVLTNGENRYGIEVAGYSRFTGSIDNTAGSSITIMGNDSAGIAILPGEGKPADADGLHGAINSQGTINITGNNSSGILVNAPVIGRITVANSIVALGKGATGVLINSRVGGEIDIDSALSVTGFYNGGATTLRPINFDGLSEGNFQIGGSALSVNASAKHGILVDTNGQLLTYGTAAALQIAPTTGTIQVDPTVGGTFGVQINGQVAGNGIYDGETASGIQIGGNAGAVIITKGIDVVNSVTATSYAADANAISVGKNAKMEEIVNSGTISATVNFGFGVNVAKGGAARAIVVYGGAVNEITNTGVISATTASGRAYALDLRGDTVFATVNQDAAGAGAKASSITGDIAFSDNGAALNVASGNIAGDISYGANAKNKLSISGGAVVDGAVTQAAGGRLALSVTNGKLASASTADLHLSTLKIGSKGEIDFAVNPANTQSGTLDVSGQAQILKGAKIGLTLDTQLTSPETFTVVQANGGLIGSSASIGSLPYFYFANIDQNDAAGTISIKVRDRTFGETGVLGSASAYNAVFAANYADTGIRGAFNAAGSQPAFKQLYQQMLPSYSGGLFEILQQGTDAIAHAEATNPLVESGVHGGGWAQQVGFGAEQGTRSTPGYHGGGLGFAFGWETPISNISSWGVTVSYLRAAVDDFNTGPNDQEVGTTYGVGAYWRENDGAFKTEASINAGVAEMNSTRNFSGTDLSGTMVTRSASAAWSGGVAQAHLGVSYEQPLGDGYYVRPLVQGDYFVLSSEKYSERNGGPGFNLNVASNTSSQGSVTGGVAVGTRWGDKFFTWKPEAMVGYKQVFGGPGDVSAAFSGGSAFSLSPASQKGGPIANLGLHGGNKYSDIGLEAGGEDRGPYKAFDGKVVARFRF
jgi:hypothetical protein